MKGLNLNTLIAPSCRPNNREGRRAGYESLNIEHYGASVEDDLDAK